MINVADLKDPNDTQGRTYREVNNSINHKYEVGQLIEISNGARLFVALLTRDCDGAPVYSLSYEPENEHYLFHGFGEDDMERV